MPTLNQLIQPQVLDRAALAAAALLVVLLGHSLATLSWSVLPQSQEPAPPPAAAAASPAEQRVAATDYEQLAGLSLFGVTATEPVAQKAPIDAPETRLNLTLRGILFNRPKPIRPVSTRIVRRLAKSSSPFRLDQ